MCQYYNDVSWKKRSLLCTQRVVYRIIDITTLEIQGWLKNRTNKQ